MSADGAVTKIVEQPEPSLVGAPVHVPLRRARRDDPIANLGPRVVDFWEWAYGALGANTTRGVFAEYLVGLLLGSPGEFRDPWAAYDVTYRGRRIEVKAAAYLQDWVQSRTSRITFAVGPTYPDVVTPATPWTREYRSDCYVLCHEIEQDRQAFHPLDLSQWRFYVLATPALAASGKVTLSCDWLEAAGAGPHQATDLRAAVDQALGLSAE